MSLFEEKEEEKEVKKKRKSYVYLVVLFRKLTFIILMISIIFNGLFIITMLFDFHVGIILFIMNFYLLILFYIKYRREKK